LRCMMHAPLFLFCCPCEKGPAMIVAWTRPLFQWDELDDSPDLKTIRNFLRILPDAKLLAALRRARGRGRNDYPVHVLWGVVVLTPLLRHTSYTQTLAELARNPSLARLVGIESPEDVPKAWNVSRFLDVLGREPFLTILREMFDELVRTTAEEVEELGCRLAGDAMSLLGRRGRSGREEGLPGPTGGRKEYEDESGRVVKVYEWFGYKLHVLVDTLHEVVVAYRVSSANVADNKMLGELLAQAERNLPGSDGRSRIETLAYDRAADDGDIYRQLVERGVKPVIVNRRLWRDEKERLLPGHDGTTNIVYDEAGTVYCYDKVSEPPIRRRMAYIGYEPQRGTLKYRCPAMHHGFRCASHRRCNAGKRYGKTVRVKCEIDLRRFPPIPRATKKFERLYRGRGAVERVNARLRLFWGVDDGNVTGARRFHARVGVVMVVHIGLAVLLAAVPKRRGVLGQTRLRKVAEALRHRVGLGGR